MAKVLTDSKHYTDIANAIREKNGEETTYKPSEMAGAIQGIQSGGADFSEVEYKLSNGFTDYSCMFRNLGQMTEVPEEILRNSGNGTNFSYMFYGCLALTTIPEFDTSNGTNFSYMFHNCNALTTIPEFDTSNGTNFSHMFRASPAIIAIPKLDLSSGTTFNGMFYGCNALTAVPELNTSSGKDFANMFYNCKALSTIPELDTSSGTNFSYMFYYCKSLTSAPDIDTSKGTDFQSMFRECASLVTIPKLDLSSNTKDLSGIFGLCSKLENVTFVGTIKTSGLPLSSSKVLTHDSIMSAIYALYDYAAEGSTSTYKLPLGSTNLAKLTDAEKAIATQKGWTLA